MPRKKTPKNSQKAPLKATSQKANAHILEEKSAQKGAKNLLQSLDSKREIAKLGMSVSLLTCVGSAFFMKNNSAKTIHVLSGVALVGFSIWHHSLYEKK
ncbi:MULTISPECIES: hypothetical protein [unclassified Helicobacter]|uniref:hypothetical protein n=1 Tax=unclassified Helicobacter TaxID=2593540 RepID=UPI002161580D|nr:MULTISPECIES: hypothetical protein [unclassified Helicobacter]